MRAERTFRRTSIPLCVSGLVAAGASLAWSPWGALPAELGEVVSGLPYAAAGVGLKNVWTDWGHHRDRMRRRAEHALQRKLEEDDAYDGLLTLAGVGLGGVDVLALGSTTTVMSRRAQTVRVLDDSVDGPVAAHLSEVGRSAAAENRSLFDGDKVDVVGVRRRWTDETGIEILLDTAPTSYLPYLTRSHSLDVALPGLPDQQPTLRHVWEGTRPFGWQDIPSLPAPVSLGTVTVARTTDGYLLAGLRGATAQSGNRGDAQNGSMLGPLKPWQENALRVAPGAASISAPRYRDPNGRPLLHFIGEGVTSTDHDVVTRTLDVRVTAVRGISEELGNVCRAGRVTATTLPLTTTAVFFDQVRWELVSTFLVQLDVDLATARRHASIARDSFETAQWIALDASSPSDPEIEQLLSGTHPQWVLASNHALVALLGALVEVHRESFVRRPGR